jgi:cytochrome P450
MGVPVACAARVPARANARQTRRVPKRFAVLRASSSGAPRSRVAGGVAFGRETRLRALSDKEAEKATDANADEETKSGECPLGFGKNGRITTAVDGIKKSVYLSFMSSAEPLTMEEAAASAAAVDPKDVLVLDNKVFLQSLKKAIEDPVGMPAAILDWHRQVDCDTVGIENPIGPGCVSTIDPRVVEYVCKTNAANYRDRLLPDIFRLVLKDLGVTGSQGEYNRQHRKVCQKPFINNTFLKTFSAVVESRVAHLCESWEMASEKEMQTVKTGVSATTTNEPPAMVTDVDLHSQHLLLDIISPISFDYNFDLLTKSREVITGSEARFVENPMLEAYHRSAEIMGEVFITPLPLLELGAKLGIGRLRELTAAYDDLEKMGDDIVKRRRAQHRETLDAGGEIEQVCLLDTMLFLEDPETGERAYTDEELWGDMNDIMAAGHQTQAATMTMALLYISRHADVKAKVETEIARLGARAPTFEDVSEGRLEYTQHVIKEVLRMHPPIHMFPRLASESDVMPTGHKVEKGDLILLSTWAMGRNPRVWEDPEAFDPDRFTDARLERLARSQAEEGATDEEIERAVTMLKSGRDFIYTPFGAGPRSCIGGLFSLLTVTTIVGSCVQKFDFSPDEASLPLDAPIPLRYDVTMCYPDGLKMKVRRRDIAAGAARGEPAPVAAGAR